MIEALIWHYGSVLGMVERNGVLAEWPAELGEMPSEAEVAVIIANYEVAHFNSVFPDKINEYRLLQTVAEVTYNGITVLNTQNERVNLARIDGDFKIVNDNTFEIDFKNIAATKKVKVADIQGLRKECFLLEQKGRSAEAVVLDNHESEPYTSLQTAYDDFDAEMGA